MAIDLASGSGLFDRLGKLKYLLNQINTNIGNESTGWPKELNDALVEYDAGSNAVRETVAALLPALTSAQQGTAVLKQAIRTAAQQTLVVMANADDPLPEQTVSAALTVLIQQMTDAAASIDASEPTIASLVRGKRTGAITAATAANPVSITSTAHGLADGDRVTISGVGGMVEINGIEFTVDVQDANTFTLFGINGSGYTTYTSGGSWKANHGTGKLRLSVVDGRGRTMENVLAEDLVFTCTNSATSGGESFNVLGEEAVSDKLDHNWPAGSGTDVQLSVVDAGSSLITNGDFETFTVANTPTGWTLDVGAAGTDFLEENTHYARGTSSLEINGDGSTLCKISRVLTGLTSRTPYAINVLTKLDVAAAAGVLQVDLWDGSAVITDDEGTANSFTVALSTHGTWFQSSGAFFRLPEPLPASVSIRVHTTTALSNTSSLFIDELTMVEATQLSNGPFVALFAGDDDFAVDDEFLATVVNARAGALQEMCDQFFDTSEAGLLIPSATGAAETIADSLIG